MVMNTGDGDVNVAITRNYVSGSNLSDVLRFLDTRKSQISGCRDRDEAVQPDLLGNEFRKALAEVGSDDIKQEEKKCDDRSEQSGKWTALLEQADRQSKIGWGCDA